MRISMRLLALAVVCWSVCGDFAFGMRIYKSRKKAMSTLSGVTVESQQFFGSCEQSTDEQACILAIDSDTSPDWTQCATAYPDDKGFAWWRGFLENPIYVASVYVQNSNWELVGEVDGMREFVISGNGHVCYSHMENVSYASRTFPCDVLADNIEIRSSIKGAVLALCVVQVQGSQLKFPTVLEPQGTLMKPADCEQTTTELSRHCWNAFDGKKEQTDLNKCAMTKAVGTNEWWKVVFTTPALIQEVVIYSRLDKQHEMTNFEILVGGRRCARYLSADVFASKSFSCNRFGADVQISQRAKFALTLCEVEVYGHEVEMLYDQKRTPLGCFAVSEEKAPALDEDFKEPASIFAVHEEKCDRLCRRQKAKYFGLFAGFECWCGNRYAEGAKVGDAECSQECEGKRKHLCGGRMRGSVFEML